eukprot:PhF_6_TR10786/c0_g1_i2/m.17336
MQYDKFQKSVISGDFEEFQHSVKDNPSLLSRPFQSGPHQGCKAIHVAAASGATQILKYIVENYSADPNEAGGPAGWTPIHFASSVGGEVLAYLMSLNVPVDSKTNDDATPLMIASAAGKTNDVRMLIEKGALLNAQDKLGDTALHYALHYRVRKTTPNYKISDRQLDVAVILVAAGIDVEIQNHDHDIAVHGSVKGLLDVLRFISQKRDHFVSCGVKWNYKTVVTVAQHSLSGSSENPLVTKGNLPQQLAEEFGGYVLKLEKGKLMSNLESKMGNEAAHAQNATPDNNSTTTAPYDPSGGKCPFFQKGGRAGSNVVNPHTDTTQPANIITDDASKPVCPFSRKGIARIGGN